MAKKQFIRHLEFYGFPDQNGYSSDINPVDLSDIIEKNKEQDKEIADLEGEKADKKDLVELSGAVETLISAQTEFNNNVVETLTDVSNDIATLKNVDNEFATQLSALTEGVNSLNEEFETFSDDTNESISALTADVAALNEKSNTYALKEDTYTKQEVNDLISGGVSGYATEEWVLSQGYFNQAAGDERYAQKETVDALSDRLNDSVLDLQTKIYTVSGSLDTYKANNDARMGTLETNFATLDGKVNREIDQISGDVASFDNRIRKNTTDIADLAEVVNRKANKSDLDNLTSTVGTLANALDGKVNTTEYDTYKSRIAQQFNDMDNVKADKSSVVAAMNEIATVDGKVAQEKVDRIAADAVLQGLIDNIEDEIVEIKEGDVHEDERITALEEGLAQEIADRQQGDLDLIGATSDTKNDDTIWGAKRFAQDQKGIAISEAATYTNNEIAGLRGEFESDFENIERELTAKANTTYVDASRNELRQTLEDEFNTALEAEKTRAQVQETQLNAKVNLNTADIQENDTKITNLTTKVKCITAWEGNDPEQYDDSGNGILDVLHREFHEFASTAGSIRDVRIEDGNLIITYITPTGDHEISTPLTSIFDADAYYDKTATDALLATKADVAALTDAVDSIIGNAPADFNDLGKVYEHVTANTQDIATANANIADNAANIATAATAIETANANIAQNTADIATASTAIAENAAAITQNTSDIAQNAADIDAAEAAIAQNTSDIAQNASDIDAAEAAIAQNTSDIAQNAADIDAAEAAITAAQTAIQDLNTGTAEIEAELATKADQAEMETALATKANKAETLVALSEKVSKQTFDNAMALKADSDYVNTMLREKVNVNTFNLEIQLLQDQIDELKRIISGGTANP